jgi:FkbM family methyltransferase
MALIHTQPINTIVRTIAKPFSKIISKKLYFAIDGTINVKLTEGKNLLFTANPTSNLLRVLFWQGIEGFEFNEYKVFTELAKESKCFFDIGANIGYYSIVAKKFNENIIVHGFEPLPGARKYFQKNIKLNNFEDITIQQIALCDKIGEAEFYSNINPRFKHLEDHLFGDSSLDINATGNFQRIKFIVKTDTLDNYITTNLAPDQKIDLIKMDTEGTENLVLKGAHNVLLNHQPIIMCEIIKGFIEKEMEVILKKYNYSFYKVKPNGLEFSLNLVSENGKTDYFLVPESKLETIKKFII